MLCIYHITYPALLKSVWTFGNNCVLLCKQIHIFKGPLPFSWKAVQLLALFLLYILVGWYGAERLRCWLRKWCGKQFLRKDTWQMVGEDTTDTAVAGQSSLSYPEATASSYIAIGSWKFAHKLFFPSVSHDPFLDLPLPYLLLPQQVSCFLLKTEKLPTPVNLLRCGSKIQHVPCESFPGNLWVCKITIRRSSPEKKKKQNQKTSPLNFLSWFSAVIWKYAFFFFFPWSPMSMCYEDESFCC